MSTQVQTASSAARARRPKAAGNVIGRMTGLTLFTPRRARRWEPVLKTGFWLGKYVPLAQKHILQFDFIHFVRWTIVHELPSVDPAKRQKLNYGYTFFESNFDGPWQHYIDAFAYVIPNDIRFVWGRGIHFPYPPPAEPLKAWIARNSMEGGHYYCAYPHASTRMCKAALEVRERLPEATRRRRAPDPRGVQGRLRALPGRPPGASVMGESRNRVAGAYALTTFAPIIAGHEEEVRAYIEGLPMGAESPLARLDTLHLSRIQIFDQLVDQGPKHDLDRLESS